MSTASETPHREGINGSHPMLTILVFVAVIAIIVGAGSMVSHERRGQDFEPTSKVPTLLERILPGGK